jgi:hypothetical protein
MSEPKKLKCGKEILVREGIDCIWINADEPNAPIQKIISAQNYCDACRVVSNLKARIAASKDAVEIESMTEDLKTITSVVSDFQEPLLDCLNEHSLIASTDRMFQDTTDIDIDEKDIAVICGYISKYGFVPMMSFMGAYANASRFGAEWLHVLIKETLRQQDRIVSHDNYINPDSETYKMLKPLIEKLVVFNGVKCDYTEVMYQ